MHTIHHSIFPPLTVLNLDFDLECPSSFPFLPQVHLEDATSVLCFINVSILFYLPKWYHAVVCHLQVVYHAEQMNLPVDKCYINQFLHVKTSSPSRKKSIVRIKASGVRA